MKNIIQNNEENKDEFNSNMVLTSFDIRYVKQKYKENYEFNSRDPYFQTSNDKFMLKDYYEREFKKIFKYNILYFLFILFLTITTILTSFPKFKYNIKRMFSQKLINSGLNDLNLISI